MGVDHFNDADQETWTELFAVFDRDTAKVFYP